MFNKGFIISFIISYVASLYYFILSSVMDITYIMTGEILSIQVAKLVLIYWSELSSSWRGEDCVIGVD